MPTKPPIRPPLVACALGVGALATAPAHADIITISDIMMDGWQVNPPIPDAGTGIARVTIDTDTRAMTIAGTYSAMTSEVLAAHLHGPADPDQNSPLIIFPLTHTGGLAGSFSGGRTLSQTQFDAFMASRTYINVHTADHTAGEIRGQIIVPGPGGPAALLGVALLATRRRRHP